MGIEKELVYTYLVAVDPSSVISSGTSKCIAIEDQQSLSSYPGDDPSSADKGFKNPFLTVPLSEGGHQMILSQREGANRPLASPMMNTDDRSHFFNATDSMGHVPRNVPIQQQM